VRGLENTIEHAFVLCAGDEIDIFDLPVEIRQLEYKTAFIEKTAESERTHVSRKKLSRQVLLELLDECDWNKAEVGRRVGLNRTAI
jgi:two-component system response regulator HydG